MTRLAEFEAHIASMSELREIVGAMRSLAGMRLVEAQRALPGIRRYAAAMAGAIGAALRLLPDVAAGAGPGAAEGQRALILCAAEHGFVGGFNERLIETAQAALRPADRLFILGSRGAAFAAERGWKPAFVRAMASRPMGAPETARRLAAELYRPIARREIARVEIIYARYRPAGAPSIAHRPLLPLDLSVLSPTGRVQPPLHNLAPESLLEKLMAEYVFALLTEAAVESIASENAARFSAMESAHDNVSKKLEELRQGAHQARQTDITTELLDLVTGAEALGPAGSGL